MTSHLEAVRRSSIRMPIRPVRAAQIRMNMVGQPASTSITDWPGRCDMMGISFRVATTLDDVVRVLGVRAIVFCE